MKLVLNSLRKLKYRSYTFKDEIKAYLSYYTKSQPPGQVRAVIFAQGRTGSTLLESLLSSSGHFRANKELLNTTRGEIISPTKFILGLSKWRSDNFIFHVKIYQLTQDRKHPIDPAAFLKTLYDEGWKIIYLRRENKIKHALSNVVAESRGAYHKHSDKKEDIKVFIDCESFTKNVKGRIEFEELEKKVLANVKYHEVVYEHDLERSDTHQRTANRIFDHLSLEQKAVSTPYKKVSQKPISALISNYDEFVKCVNENGWGNFLEQ